MPTIPIYNTIYYIIVCINNYTLYIVLCLIACVLYVPINNMRTAKCNFHIRKGLWTATPLSADTGRSVNLYIVICIIIIRYCCERSWKERILTDNVWHKGDGFGNIGRGTWWERKRERYDCAE